MEVPLQDLWVQETRSRDLALGVAHLAMGKTRGSSMWERVGWGWCLRCEVGVVAEALPGSSCGEARAVAGKAHELTVVVEAIRLVVKVRG